MDLVIKGPKGTKKGLIIKTWERCRSLSGIGRKSTLSRGGGGGNGGGYSAALKHKSKSWPRSGTRTAIEEKEREKRGRVVPEGCFSVYVGQQKQRFVIRTECLNHPLFKILLEEAESEYGYTSEGPLELPCEVDLFLKVLMEMDCDEISPRCSFKKTYSSYQLLTPPRLLPTLSIKI